MTEQKGPTAIAIAIIGAAGIVAAAIVGYQSGVGTVNKDYVQIAMTNLRDNDSSPELRRWSTQVLNELSPVKMSASLERELTRTVYVSPEIPIPESADEDCPDIITETSRSAPSSDKDRQRLFERFVREYETCRARYTSLRQYLREISALSKTAPD